LSLQQRDFVPAGDITIEFPGPTSELRAWSYQSVGSPTAAVSPSAHAPADELERGGTYVALALNPKLPNTVDTSARRYVLVVDRSRSMFGEQFRRASEFVEKFIAEMDHRDMVAVVACDTVCNESNDPMQPASPELALRAREFLHGQRPEGASDLTYSLRFAQHLAERAGTGPTRILYVGDGTPTVGPVLPGLIANEVDRVMRPETTLTAITVGSTADTSALRAATSAAGGVLLTYSPGQSVAEAVYDALSVSYGNVLRDARLQLPEGLTRVTPAQLGSIAPGSEQFVVARMTGDRVSGKVKLEGQLGQDHFERTYDLDLAATSASGNAFVERLYAATRIAELEQQSSSWAKQRTIELSERFNVASRHTSLLVLESPAMFKAFGLNNERTAAIWTGEESSVSSEALSTIGNASRSDPRSTSGAGGLPLGDFEDGLSGGVAKRAPRPSSKPKRSRPRPAACGCSPSDLLCAMECDAREERFAPPPPSPRPRRMIPMRRVWQSVGQISDSATRMDDHGHLVRLEDDLRQDPNSRGALKALYAAYVGVGDFARAQDLAERWSAKDPLDPDALTARADLAAQRGERALAIRILGSVVDVRPGDYRAQWRLARLFRWAGRSERSCRHAVTIAQLRPDDAQSLTDAVACARSLGKSALAGDLLAAADATLRRQAEAKQPTDFAEVLSGEFQVEADWVGSDHDLDLVLIHPDGYRVSWLGAPTHAVITARDVLSTRQEGLALRGAKTGRYGVEIVRAADSSGPVSGRLRVRFRNQTRELPFVLDGERLRLADVDVSMRSRLVPL
jgi:tetratricopeptide (TPR) repeat protein